MIRVPTGEKRTEERIDTDHGQQIGKAQGKVLPVIDAPIKTAGVPKCKQLRAIGVGRLR